MDRRALQRRRSQVGSKILLLGMAGVVRSKVGWVLFPSSVCHA